MDKTEERNLKRLAERTMAMYPTNCERIHHGYLGLGLIGAGVLAFLSGQRELKAAAFPLGLAGAFLFLDDLQDMQYCLR